MRSSRSDTSVDAVADAKSVSYADDVAHFVKLFQRQKKTKSWHRYFGHTKLFETANVTNYAKQLHAAQEQYDLLAKEYDSIAERARHDARIRVRRENMRQKLCAVTPSARRDGHRSSTDGTSEFHSNPRLVTPVQPATLTTGVAPIDTPPHDHYDAGGWAFMQRFPVVENGEFSALLKSQDAEKAPVYIPKPPAMEQRPQSSSSRASTVEYFCPEVAKLPPRVQHIPTSPLRAHHLQKSHFPTTPRLVVTLKDRLRLHRWME